MQTSEFLLASLENSNSYLTKALDGLTQEEAAWSPGTECNSIAFILWHMVRLEDFYINRVIQREAEFYEREGWREKLGTPVNETGYQYTTEQLRAWPVPQLSVLVAYSDSVRHKTVEFLRSVDPKKLSEVPRPERSTETVSGMLARITTHIALHVGQVTYLRGMQRGLDR